MNQEAPKWFEKAIANKPEALSVKIKGTKIAYNAWGEKSKPGLIFIHGGMAHADWSRVHVLCGDGERCLFDLEP